MSKPIDGTCPDAPHGGHEPDLDHAPRPRVTEVNSTLMSSVCTVSWMAMWLGPVC